MRSRHTHNRLCGETHKGWFARRRGFFVGFSLPVPPCAVCTCSAGAVGSFSINHSDVCLKLAQVIALKTRSAPPPVARGRARRDARPDSRDVRSAIGVPACAVCAEPCEPRRSQPAVLSPTSRRRSYRLSLVRRGTGTHPRSTHAHTPCTARSRKLYEQECWGVGGQSAHGFGTNGMASPVPLV